MKTDIWILSADAHTARLFCAESPHSKEIVEIETFLQPETVLKEQDLVSDGLGRYNQAGDQHHPKLPRTSPKDKRIQEFARHLGDYLETEHNKGHFAKLGLVAEPHMLGELRSQLSPNLARDICFEIDKNFTQLNSREFRQHLPDRLTPMQ
jgi:protein required for attachment to host cells